MKTSELREKSVSDLKELNDEQRRELFDMRFRHYTQGLVDTASLKKTRRDIARIETIIREREIAQTNAE
jgi:large subunit ribosomal protein L29